MYEQFIDQRKLKGAIYTPEVLADYLLSDMEAVKPLTAGMTVLDPACGSGVFLVLALRRLIEQQIAASQDGRISLTMLTHLLDNIYGVERERDACYVTEFSLLLTILHYIDPPELHKNRQFQFPSLHNTHIFQGDFFDDSLGLWQNNPRFDWIVGNPPWVNVKAEGQQEANSEQQQHYASSWIKKNASTHPVGTHSVAEAFSWRVDDALADDGLVGLIMPAMSLVNLNSRKYRQAFFAAHKVYRITNFANFRRFLFGGRSEAPAATVVYRRATQGGAKPEIVHNGPFAVNQIPHLKGAPWALTINEDEIQTIAPDDAEQGDTLTWKLALWGTYRDRRALEQLEQLFPTTLEAYCQLQGWGTGLPQEGLQLRDGEGSERAVKSEKLTNTKVLSPKRYNKGSRPRFHVPENLLIPNENHYIRLQGGKTALRINEAPHILISTGWDCVVYSDVDFVIPPRQMGISAKVSDGGAGDQANGDMARRRRLKALCFYLNSTLVRYYLFFHAPEWGFFRRRETVVATAVRTIPTPNFTDAQVARLAHAYDQLVWEEQNAAIVDGGAMETLHKVQQARVDDVVSEVCQIPDDLQVFAAEFIGMRLRLDQDKAATKRVTRAPSGEEFARYARELQNEFEDFMMGERRPSVEITWSDDLTECVVELPDHGSHMVDARCIVREGDVSRARLLNSISADLRQRIGQWTYVQRGLRLYDGPRIYLYKPTRLISWTRTQAMKDAADIIAYSIQAGTATG